MKTSIKDLREHLFATIEALRDTDNPMDISRARAVAEVAGQVIESAKVEVEFLRVTGREHDAGFLTPPPPVPGAGPATRALANTVEGERSA